MNLREISVRQVNPCEEERYLNYLQTKHYLGALRKISETIWYIAVLREEWIALLSFSASALKCAARDNWIGWDMRHQYDRLKLITNNSRFLILTERKVPNLGSRILSLCQRRISSDWRKKFGHPVLLLETFVDPRYFHGTVYKAANWLYVGKTKGFSRIGSSYSSKPEVEKMIFVKPLRRDARNILTSPTLNHPYITGGTRIMLRAEHMSALPDFFSEIPDPRRAQGRRHRLSTILAISAGAILCGMRGFKGIHDWAKKLGKKARQRFQCRYEKGKYIIPSESVIRNVLIRVDPFHLDRAINKWNEVYGQEDDCLSMDGKVMCNAIDDQGQQTHIMSVVGHQSKICYTQKK